MTVGDDPVTRRIARGWSRISSVHPGMPRNDPGTPQVSPVTPQVSPVTRRITQYAVTPGYTAGRPGDDPGHADTPGISP